MTVKKDALRVSLVTGLLVSALLFGIGISIERRGNDEHGSQETPGIAEGEAGTEAEAGEGDEGEQHAEVAEGEQNLEQSEEASERIFGIDLESNTLVAAAIAASVFLAISVWLRPVPIVLLGVLGFALFFAAFDSREAVHQIHESRSDIVAIALVLAVLHLALAALAVGILRARPRTAAVASG